MEPLFKSSLVENDILEVLILLLFLVHSYMIQVSSTSF